jgi:hypothetical protein
MFGLGGRSSYDSTSNEVVEMVVACDFVE